MSSWAIVAIVALVIWGAVELNKARRGKDGGSAGEVGTTDGPHSQQHDPDAQREIEELRERIKVLERIATDGNSPAARETKRIASEIEALRDKQAD